MKRLIGLSLASALSFGIAAAHAQETVTIWWTKPDYAAEEEFLIELGKKFTEETGIAVQASYFSSSDMITKTTAAIGAGEPPDIAFGATFDSTSSPKWAYDDQLVDLSEIVAGHEGDYHKPALNGATFLNGKTGQKALYGYPLGQVLRTFNYWKTMLDDAGYTEADIPKDWDGFWNFWCDSVQTKLQDAGNRVNGVGQGMSGTAGGSDIYHPFYVELAAYGVNWIDEDTGKLKLDDPAVREGFIKAYDHFTGLYTRGCVPDSVTTWTNEDNNTYFHNKSIVITSVASLSIVNRYLDDGDEEVYFDETRTIGYPNAPDGKPVGNVSQTRSVIVPKAAKNIEGAKKFLAYFAKPENLEKYNEVSNGQVFPALKVVGETAFWTDPKDPHKFATYQNYKTALESDRIIRFPNHFAPSLSAANAENVWGQTMGKIIVDKVPTGDAVDQLFARLNELTKQ